MSVVLFLTRWYPPHSGHFIRDLAEAVSHYTTVCVLTVVPDPSIKFFSLKFHYCEETEQSIKTVRIRCHQLKSRMFIAGVINQLFYIISQVRGLLFFLRRKIKFDLIHVHILSRTAIVPFFLKLVFRKPFIITEYWTRYLPESNSYRGFFRKKLTARVVRYADAVIAISDYLKEAMEKEGMTNANFRVIPVAINTGLFTPGSDPVSQMKKRIIHISTFSDKAKNITGILRAIKELSGHRNDFELHLTGGEVPFTQPAIEYAKQLGLYGNKVFFQGVKFGKDLAEEIRHADFLVMFSNYETFSVVIQESLSCGKPVIASKTGPLPDLVKEDSGILVSQGNEKELIEALDFMLDHYQDYDPNQIHENVENSFGYRIIGKVYSNLYEGLINQWGK